MITLYEFIGSSKQPWHFFPANFGRINLLVGASSSGKTRFLNTLFNFSNFVSKGLPFPNGAGRWNLEISSPLTKYHYTWHFDVGDEPRSRNVVQRETLILRDPSGDEKTIVDRTPDKFKFLDNLLPKLQSDVPSVTLLKEEPLIQPLYHIFSHMERRTFHDVGLATAATIQNVPRQLIDILNERKNLETIWALGLADFGLSAKLFLLEKFFPEIYQTALKSFIDVFPTVQAARIQFLTSSQAPFPDLDPREQVPVLTIKEKGIEPWLSLADLSSGMQKVLLIVTDILTLPGDCVYIIDEYENSLGVNAIDFLPSFLIDRGGNNQFFITTHHPYLINNMPIKNWRIFTRQGSNVHIRLGEELEARYGKSKQKAFIQLINDPIYTEGVQ